MESVQLESVQQSYDLESFMLICSVMHWPLIDLGIDHVARLLEQGADVNKRYNNMLLPLHCACMTGDADIVDMLLQHGAQVNALDGFSLTALHYAAECFRSDNAECVQLLLAAGADINARDGSGATALHWASYRGSVNCVQALVSCADASVNTVDAHHSTPLSWASKRPSAACIDVLLRHNASPNIADADGRTALIHAALSPAGAERDASILLLARATGLLDLYNRQARLPPGRALVSLLSYLGDCRSLCHLCRYIIRSCRGSQYLPSVTPLLPLPQQLREFILLQR